jgi:hypothetical protein
LTDAAARLAGVTLNQRHFALDRAKPQRAVSQHELLVAVAS